MGAIYNQKLLLRVTCIETSLCNMLGQGELESLLSEFLLNTIQRKNYVLSHWGTTSRRGRHGQLQTDTDPNTDGH